MKNYVVIAFILLLLSTYSCINVEESMFHIQEEESEMVKMGKEIAKIHNDCLEEVYKDLINTSTRAAPLKSEELEDFIITSANKYVSKNMTTRSEDTEGEIQPFNYGITVEEVKTIIPYREFYYIETILRNYAEINLIDELESDEELSYDQKKAVMGFILVYQASSEYWNKNLDLWSEVLNKPQTRANASSIAFADAWWGYQALLATGLNPIVGGGMTAVSSTCTAFL